MNTDSIENSIGLLQDCLEQIHHSIELQEAKGYIEQAFTLVGVLKGQIEADAERKQAEVQAVYQAKAKFVSVVTHELRTPMTSIKGYTDLLRTGVVGPINDQQTAFLNTIRNNVERMSALVSDLSDLNHMDTGRMHLEYSLFPLPFYVAETIQQFQPRINEKKQTVELDIPGNCPPVYADKSRFTQILAILLSNATRYTPEGGRIRIRASQAGELARVEVEDNGIGISAEDQEKLFTQFFRSEDPAVRELAGWGLGLVVAKRLVELMGGKVGLISQLKNGSTFWFTLPVSPDG